MSNALVKQDNRTQVAMGGAVDPFLATGEAVGGSNATYLKCNGNSGEYTYGQEAEELEHGTRLAANILRMRHGWICWKDNEVVEEIMVPVAEGKPPLKSELPDHGPYVVNDDQRDGWQEQMALELKDPATGKEFIYKVNSKSALRAFGTLLQDFGKVYKSKPGMIPIVELQTRTWMPKVKKHGKKHAPHLPIVDWKSEEELNAAFGDNEGDYEGGDDQTENDQVEGGEEEGNEPETTQPAAPATKPATTAPANAGPRRRGF